jgi:lipopolysaccharide export LptBFGC system permease protein LptF
MLARSGYPVGQFVQPRYMLPLLVVFVGVLATAFADRAPSRKAGIVVGAGVVVAHSVALFTNLGRYVQGGANAGIWGTPKWWWWSGSWGPTLVWMLGSLAFAVVAAVLIAWVLPAKHATEVAEVAA